jgi:glyoxylase I family protein
MYVNDMTSFPPVTHFAVTVSDLDRSVAWYQALFGAPPFFVGDETTYRFAVWLEPSFALHQHHAPAGDETFDELRIGLDHIAFGCSSRDELEAWLPRLDEMKIVHGGIADAFYGCGLAFRDPDNIQLEFFVPAA